MSKGEEAKLARTSRASNEAVAFTRGGSAEQLTRPRRAARVRTLARAESLDALVVALRAERARARPRPCGQSARACMCALLDSLAKRGARCAEL